MNSDKNIYKIKTNHTKTKVTLSQMSYTSLLLTKYSFGEMLIEANIYDHKNTFGLIE